MRERERERERGREREREGGREREREREGEGEGRERETLMIFSLIWALISSRETSSLCCTLTTTVWTLSGTHAPSSSLYSTVTCEGGVGEWVSG